MGGENVKIFHTGRQCSALFIVGFLAGIIYVNLMAGQYSGRSDLFSAYFLNQLQNMEVKTGEYLWYLLKARGIPLAIVILISRTRAKKAGAGIFLFWTGISAGVLISTAILELGIRGSLLCVIGVFPQFLFYIPAILLILLYCWRWPQCHWERQKTLFVAGMMVTGIFCELYINPVLLRVFLKFL